MLHPFEQSVLRHALALIPPRAGQRVVVGVSGGSDSTALLCALAACASSLDVELVVAHLDHGWRSPAAGAEDAAAVAALAAELGLACVSERVEPSSWRGSREAGARRARYAFLGRVAAERDAAAVALGHTRDDQVETILLRALRGTGLRGLGGMPAKRALSASQAGVSVVRPLLELSRAEARAYLQARGQAWREDPSNAEDGATRNRLRREVLPLLRERINPRADEALLRLARQARRATRGLAPRARALLAEGLTLRALREAEGAVRAEALSRFAEAHAPGQVSARHVDGLERLVLHGRGALTLPGGARIGVRAERLAVLAEARRLEAPRIETPLALSAPPQSLAVPGAVDDPAGVRIEARIAPVPPASEWRTDPAQRALLDAERVEGALAVRRRRPGDRFWPLGAPGTRTLKRFLIDQKVPRASRDAIPVVTSNDRPVWIVGLRIDERFKVTPSTVKVLELRACRAASGEKKGERDG